MSEYRRFQNTWLNIMLATQIVFAGLFVLFDWFDVNDLGDIQLMATEIGTLATLALFILNRRLDGAYVFVAILFLMVAIGLYTSALLHVPKDELRVVWFFLAIPAAFILLGRIGGLITTLAVIGIVIGVNRHVATPYANDSIITITLALMVSAVFSHAYISHAYRLYRHLEQANAELRELAATDPLTGILNARAYYAIADSHIQLAHREGIPCSILFIDLDHFKRVNDEHGHAAGDLALKQVAKQLGAGCRRSDIIGRIGGEEFSIFLPNTALEGAVELAEKLRAGIEQLSLVFGEQLIHITASIGVACKHPSHRGIDDLLREADRAMYRAKGSGRNRVCLL